MWTWSRGRRENIDAVHRDAKDCPTGAEVRCPCLRVVKALSSVKRRGAGTGVCDCAPSDALCSCSVAIVETTTKTPEVPFGDTFINTCRFILTAVSPTETRLVVTGLVKFLKQTMFKSKDC